MTTKPITEWEWRHIMDFVWGGYTLFQAADLLGIDGIRLDIEMSNKMRRYMLDIGIMVNAREDLFTEMRVEGEPTTLAKHEIATIILQKEMK